MTSASTVALRDAAQRADAAECARIIAAASDATLARFRFVNSPDAAGNTALHLAAGHDVTGETVTPLLSHRAEMHVGNADGATAMHAAARNLARSAAPAVALVRYGGTNATMLDNAGKTARDVALACGNVAVAAVFEDDGT